MEWYFASQRPLNSSKQNPIWIYSKKLGTVILGYFSGSFFDMHGDGVPCFMWCELTKPDPPKTFTDESK